MIQEKQNTVETAEVTIRRADINDMDTAIEILDSNFSNDSVSSWLVPDPKERPKVMRELFHVYLTLGIQKGIVHMASLADVGVVGVAIWWPHDAADESTNEQIEFLAGGNLSRFREFGDTMQAHQPPIAPYEQLIMLAVLPTAHGFGIGSKLLARRLQDLDKLGVPTYLEASTRVAAGGVYQRFGYQPVGEPVHFHGGVELLPMWRNAHEPNLAEYVYWHNYNEATENIMRFGGHDWRVLAVQDGNALLISDKVIEVKKYHEQNEKITWVNCSLRRYLNETFYNTFSEAEQSRILETRLRSYNNPLFGTDGGKYTNDKVFVLSIEEVVKYFGDSNQLRDKNRNTKYFINDNFNNVRKAVNMEYAPSCWWLRSPGNTQNFVACVTSDGRIAVSGDFVNRSNGFVLGVRPVLWLKL